MKKLKFLSILTVISMILALASGCGATSTATEPAAPAAESNESAAAPATEKKDGALPILGAGIYSAADNFNAFIAQGIRDTAEGLMEVTIEDGQSDQSVQMNQVDTMLARGAQVIALSIVDVTAAPMVIEKAKAGGDIPVIFFNNDPDAQVLLSYDKAYYVGSTIEGGFGAQIQGQMVAAEWKANPELDKNGDGKIQIVYLMGDPGHAAARPRADAVKKAIEDAGIGYEVLAEDTGMWQTADAKDKMDAWISRFGDSIEFIITANDAMALGALQSIQAAGFNAAGSTDGKYIPVIGIDAIPEILSKIDSGEVMGSVLQDARTQGAVVVKMAYNLSQGKDPLDGLDYELDAEKGVRIEYKAVTIENLGEADESYRK